MLTKLPTLLGQGAAKAGADGVDQTGSRLAAPPTAAPPRPLPPIDAAQPQTVQTATFALG